MTKADMQTFINQDWKEAEQAGVGGSQMGIVFTLDVDEDLVTASKLMLQYEENAAEYKQKVETEAVLSF